MNDAVNRQILLVQKPTGKLGPEHFRMSAGTVPEPNDGEMLVRTRYISLDAANRQVVVQLIHEAKAQGTAVVGIFHDEEVRDAVANRRVDFSPI